MHTSTMATLSYIQRVVIQSGVNECKRESKKMKDRKRERARKSKCQEGGKEEIGS